jgi:hypothetical protein
MSTTYTIWVHHGEEAESLGTDIIGSSDMHGSHHEDRIIEEEEDEDINIFLVDRDLVRSLFTSKEQAGISPTFERVLANLKQASSPRSTYSRFSLLIKLLNMKSHN